MSYIKGDTIRVTATFTVADVATDPATVTLRVKDPAGTTTVYTYALTEITKVSTGVYRKDVQMSTAGTWYVRWEGTGTAAGVEEAGIVIGGSRVV